MIYAVFEDGSRQYRVDTGNLVRVDKRDAEVGARIEFDRVVVFQTGEGLQVGRPFIEGARVVGEVVDHPSEKTYVQKFRRRKNYRRLKGHRQFYTRIRIVDLILPGWERPVAEEEPEAEEAAPETTAEAEEEAGDETEEDEDEEQEED